MQADDILSASNLKTQISSCVPESIYVYLETDERAAQARRRLADSFFYPPAATEHDSGFDVLEGRQRTALREAAGRLSRTDLAAVLQLAQLLVAGPRRDEIFGYVQRVDEMVWEVSTGV